MTDFYQIKQQIFLDEACSRINLNNKELYQLEILKGQLKAVQEEKEEAALADSTEDYKKAAELKAKRMQFNGTN